jgi:hypothetical protein
MKVNVQLHVLAALPIENGRWYPLVGVLGTPQRPTKINISAIAEN